MTTCLPMKWGRFRGVASTKLTRKENVILIALVTMVTVSLE